MKVKLHITILNCISVKYLFFIEYTFNYILIKLFLFVTNAVVGFYILASFIYLARVPLSLF